MPTITSPRRIEGLEPRRDRLGPDDAPIRLRMRVATHRAALTEQLAEGADPTSSPELALRASPLTSDRRRWRCWSGSLPTASGVPFTAGPRRARSGVSCWRPSPKWNPRRSISRSPHRGHTTLRAPRAGWPGRHGLYVPAIAFGKIAARANIYLGYGTFSEIGAPTAGPIGPTAALTLARGAPREAMVAGARRRGCGRGCLRPGH